MKVRIIDAITAKAVYKGEHRTVHLRHPNPDSDTYIGWVSQDTDNTIVVGVRNPVELALEDDGTLWIGQPSALFHTKIVWSKEAPR